MNRLITFLFLIFFSVSSLASMASDAPYRYNEYGEKIMKTRFEKVKDVLYEGSMISGIEMSEFVALSSLESGLIPNIKNGEGSSATGLFQITSSTWRGIKQRYAKEMGFTLSASRADAKANAYISARWMVDTKAMIVENTTLTNKTVRTGDIYIVHFLGENGGLKVLKADPNTPLNKVVRLGSGNKGMFYHNGKVRTVGEFRSFMQNRILQEAKVYHQESKDYQIAKLMEKIDGKLTIIPSEEMRLVVRTKIQGFIVT